MAALSSQTADSTFIKTMLVNTRLLNYTATRFIWARTIVDRWNWVYNYKTNGKKDDSRFNDINSSAHGLTVDLMDFGTELREEYKQAWLSENMNYRMGTMAGRFDSEYLFWRNWYIRLVDYNKRNDISDSTLKFEEIFLKTQH
jgi:hexosaminidase